MTRRFKAHTRRIAAATFLWACLISLPQSAVLAADRHAELHPRLLFKPEELSDLRQRASGGGNAAAAYAQIVDIVRNTYRGRTPEEVLDWSLGVASVPNLALVAHIEQPPDSEAVEIGRQLVFFLEQNYAPDDNVFFSPLRLRALCIGYDAFLFDDPPATRARILALIEDYMDAILDIPHYERWLHPPYRSNITAMIGSALGFAAVCVADESDPERIERAFEMSDRYLDVWREHLVDPHGTYNEGAMYAGWSMTNICYYAWARVRYDGYDPTDHPRLRAMEEWIAFAMLPSGGSKVNNLNDAASLNYPLSRHFPYLEWAQYRWGSGLSAWLWERLVGPDYGRDAGTLADKATTVLWNRDVPPRHPSELLPRSKAWKQRGLYYFRTGWPQADASDDVLFSFYSGKFQGGHSQEDQNSFTLYGYGESFAIDHGFGWTSRDSESHNMIFVDGQGQHHSGGSVGTDGELKTCVIGDNADLVFGDATHAYTTHSDFNRPGFPFPDDDWSGGYIGANPVLRAHRRILVAHGASTPPHFFVFDDIQKDEAERRYDWRLHTADDNAVEVAQDHIVIRGENGFANVYPLGTMPEVATEAYDNGDVDPDAIVITLGTDGVSGEFNTLMVPGNEAAAMPNVTSSNEAWGTGAAIAWPQGPTDAVVVNRQGGSLSHAISTIKESPRIDTDARIARLRFVGGDVEELQVFDATFVDIDGENWVSFGDGPVTFSLNRARVHLDRTAAFRINARVTSEVYVDAARVASYRADGYLVPDPLPGAPVSAAHIRLRAFPNPFRSSTSVDLELGDASSVHVEVFDVAGRRVAELHRGDLGRGVHSLAWDGNTATGNPAASGIYFVRASSSLGSASKKINLVR